MRRREFIALLGGAAAAWPLAARAQQPAVPVIGFLGSNSPELYVDRLRALRDGLKETGHAEGQNLSIEYRWAQGRNDRLPELAEDLVRRRPAAIITSTTPSTLALKAATATIPILFFIAGDPVALRLVGSLNRPGGNFTGTTTLTLEVGTKWLQLLHEMVPAATGFAVMLNPTSPALAKVQRETCRPRPGPLGCRFTCSTPPVTVTSIRSLQGWRSCGQVGSSSADSFFFTRAEQLAAIALRRGVPTIFGFREFAAAGGLMSYGANILEAHRGLGIYAGRILKGEKPADLPVQQAVKVDLVINMATARMLRMDVRRLCSSAPTR